MRKLDINGVIYYCHTKSGKLYLDFKRTKPVPASYFDEADQWEIIRQIENDKRKNNAGGARDNSGRKSRTTEEQRNRSVFLTDSEVNYLTWKHGTFANAVRSLLQVGWEFEEN